MLLDAREGIKLHIDRLKDTGILMECQSQWNTPFLPKKKDRGKDYWLAQDLTP